MQIEAELRSIEISGVNRTSDACVGWNRSIDFDRELPRWCADKDLPCAAQPGGTGALARKDNAIIHCSHPYISFGVVVFCRI